MRSPPPPSELVVETASGSGFFANNGDDVGVTNSSLGGLANSMEVGFGEIAGLVCLESSSLAIRGFGGGGGLPI